MPAVWVVEITDDWIDVNLGGEIIRINYADIPGNGWPRARLRKLRDRAQDFIDIRIPLADLPDGDPDKVTDPELPSTFWDGNDLVSRSTLVEEIIFDGTRLIPTLKAV